MVYDGVLFVNARRSTPAWGKGRLTGVGNLVVDVQKSRGHNGVSDQDLPVPVMQWGRLRRPLRTEKESFMLRDEWLKGDGTGGVLGRKCV